jgi:hypothetical protein
LKDALEVCSREEAEQERPELQSEVERLLPDTVKRKNIDVAAMLCDKDDLVRLSKNFFERATRLRKEAGGSLTELEVERVRFV